MPSRLRITRGTPNGRRLFTEEPEPRKPTKQLSFVDPDNLKRLFRNRPQTRKTSARHETTATTESSTTPRPNNGERTSKYSNPQLYQEPEYPQVTIAPEAELSRKLVNTKFDSRRRDSGDFQPQIDPRKATTSNLGRRKCHVSLMTTGGPLRLRAILIKIRKGQGVNAVE